MNSKDEGEILPTLSKKDGSSVDNPWERHYILSHTFCHLI